MAFILILLVIKAQRKLNDTNAQKRYYVLYYWSQNGWAEVISAFQFDRDVPFERAYYLILNHTGNIRWQTPASKVKNMLRHHVFYTDENLCGKSPETIWPQQPVPIHKYTSETIPIIYNHIKYFEGYLTLPSENSYAR